MSEIYERIPHQPLALPCREERGHTPLAASATDIGSLVRRTFVAERPQRGTSVPRTLERAVSEYERANIYQQVYKMMNCIAVTLKIKR